MSKGYKLLKIIFILLYLISSCDSNDSNSKTSKTVKSVKATGTVKPKKPLKPAAKAKKLAPKLAVCIGKDPKMELPKLDTNPRNIWSIYGSENYNQNADRNFVWPMETIEKTYFFVKGIGMLIEASPKQYKIVEPNICDNTISLSGAPLSRYMYYENIGSDVLVSYQNWTQINKQYNYKSRINVFYLDIHELAKDSTQNFCKLDTQDQTSFCYKIITLPGKENRFVLLTRKNTSLGKATWSRIFHLIRNSDWAKNNHINDESVITLGLYGPWHHNLFTLNMIFAVQSKYGNMAPSAYMIQAAKKILTSNLSQRVSTGAVDTVIAWRIQKQFLLGTKFIYGSMRSDLTFQADKGGFIVGCQMGNIVLKTNENTNSTKSTVALIFDIFEYSGIGAEGIQDFEVGPTRNVRRQMVKSLKTVYNKLVIVEAMLRKISREDLQLADPLGLLHLDRPSFISWLEVAIAYSAKLLVQAGGHFGEILAEFRKGVDVLDVYPPQFCANVTKLETGEEITTDDELSQIMFSKKLDTSLVAKSESLFGNVQKEPDNPSNTAADSDQDSDQGIDTEAGTDTETETDTDTETSNTGNQESETDDSETDDTENQDTENQESENENSEPEKEMNLVPKKIIAAETDIAFESGSGTTTGTGGSNLNSKQNLNQLDNIPSM